MVNYNAPLFQNPPDVWDEKQCEKAAKHWYRDGYGTKHHRQGYLGDHFGKVRYNGGCVRPMNAPREKQHWYQGENFPLPIVADGYEIIHVLTWGYYIQKKGTK